ncbi:MAG: hypothetical protein WB799_12565 [Candidatus Sulfotelmatobacter sp.]
MRYRTAAILSVVLIGGMFVLPAAVKDILLPSLERGVVIPFYERLLLGVAVFFLSWRVILAFPIVVLLFTIAVFTNETADKGRPAAATPVKRPTGVVVIAGLNILGGVAVIAVELFQSQPLQGIALGLLVTVGLLGVGLGGALLKLENWARVLMIVLSGLSLIAIPGRAAMAHSLAGAIAILVRGLFLLWIVWYLFQPHIKAAFGRHR